MTLYRVVSACVVFAAFLGIGLPATVAGVGTETLPEPIRPRVVASEESALILELEVPELRLEPAIVDGTPCQVVRIDGLVSEARPGWLQLPVSSALLGIPPGSIPQVTLLDEESTVVPGSTEVCPCPQSFRARQNEREPGASGDDHLDPQSPVELERAGLVRSQEIAVLRIYPVQYDRVSHRLQFHRRLRLRIDFSADGESVAGSSNHIIDEGSFEGILRSNVLNYEQARPWRVRPPSATEPRDTPRQGPFKVLVEEDGIHLLTYTRLNDAGFPVGTEDPRGYFLLSGGTEVAIAIPGEDDGSFDSGDVLLFYGQPAGTRHTDVNVYWLGWGAVGPERMDPLDGTPGSGSVPPDYLTTRRMEEDQFYRSESPSGPDADRWYWDTLYAATGSSDEVDLLTTLTGISTQPGRSVTVRGLVRGYSADPLHHIQVELNGHLVDDAYFAPGVEYAFEVSVSQETHLVEGTNTVTVRTIEDGGITPSIVFVNWVEIDYHQTYVADGDISRCDGDGAGLWRYQVTGFETDELEVFDVTDPGLPAVVDNLEVVPDTSLFTLSFELGISEEHHYLAQSTASRIDVLDTNIFADQPSDLHSATNGADYIVITHADFASAVQPLADHRALQGLRTQVVDVQDVYDEFSHGVFDPQAIADFLAHAYANWQAPPPSFVVLVGDGHYDPMDNLGRGEPVWIPPYLADVDPWMGETAADNRFVTVSGGDILPDMHVGRLPCRTPAEATAMVAKIIGYEQNAAAQGWTWRSLFVADNMDAAGDFAALSDSLIDQSFPATNEPQRVYYGVTHTDIGDARAALLSGIEEGCLLVSYIGHAGQNAWAMENLLDIPAIDSLGNGDRLPFMVPMTNQEGYFIRPSPVAFDYSCLGESIVRASARGAVASWSPTGLGVATGHQVLAQGLYDAIFSAGMVEIGPATTQAKIDLFGGGSDLELIDTYVLFGDPALELQLAEDMFFADGFEVGDVGRWSGSVP
jgi:hypothetical protein